MNRLYLLALIVIAAAAALAAAVVAHPGYVLISYRNFRYESGLWTFFALLALIWLAVYLLRVLQRGAWTSGGLINPWSQRHRARRARQAARLGLLDLAEGRWSDALRHLQRAAARDPQPLLHYLGAARAANEMGQTEQSERFLEQALASEPKAQLAVGLTRTRLLIARGERAAALAQVQALNERHPRQPQVLKLLQQLYVDQHDWQALSELMPELRRQQVLEESRLTTLERGVWLELLAANPEASSEALQRQWKRLPASLRHDAQLLGRYAARLQAAGAPAEAQKLLAREIGEQYDPALVTQYADLQGKDPAEQLRVAEGWLAEHPHDATLLLALGRLSQASQLWGKARSYLEASLRLERRAETLAELARLLDQLGERDNAGQLMREALEQNLGYGRAAAPHLRVITGRSE
jgi:HemY protein